MPARTWRAPASSSMGLSARRICERVAPMPHRLTPFLPGILVTLLGACAATAQSEAGAGRSESDCSFRSATTCWTVARRVRPAGVETLDSVPKELFEQPPRALASGADTARRSGH